MKPLPRRSRMEGDLLTLAVTGSCAGRLARATAAREGGGVCERGASAFMPVVCFTARPATGMMKSKAAVG